MSKNPIGFLLSNIVVNPSIKRKSTHRFLELKNPRKYLSNQPGRQRFSLTIPDAWPNPCTVKTEYIQKLNNVYVIGIRPWHSPETLFEIQILENEVLSSIQIDNN